MTYVFILIYWLPTWIEGYLDRKGETKKSKRNDTIWLIVVAIGITGGAWASGFNPWTAPLFIFIWRVCTFDYIVHYFLKKYSEGHKNINIWKFSGTTAFWDRIVSRIPPMWRLLIRACLLVASLWLYLAY